jgi:hypothetical protein
MIHFKVRWRWNHGARHAPEQKTKGIETENATKPEGPHPGITFSIAARNWS